MSIMLNLCNKCCLFLGEVNFSPCVQLDFSLLEIYMFNFFKFSLGWKHSLSKWNEFLADDLANSLDAPQEFFVQVWF